MGLETDWARDDVQDGRYKMSFMIVEIIFLGIFSGEIAVRLRTHRCRFFWDSWNLFDLVVVGVGMVTVCMELLFEQNTAALSFTSTLRALRLLRLARIVKLIRLFRELYLLVNGITSAMRALFWVAIMTILVILVCSIFITRVIGQRDTVRQYAFEGPCQEVPYYYTRPRPAGSDPYFDPVESPLLACQTLDYFGTVPQSMFSLFCVMTLEGWPDMSRTLVHRSSGGGWATVFFFIVFVFFTNIFLLNLVTGVIVENVLLIAHQDEIEQVRREKKERDNKTQKLNEIFELADTDNSETVSREEFHSMLLNPDASAILRSLDIHIWDAEDLFDILDVDDSGEMDLKEFFEGFSRVKGSAMDKHLMKLHYDLLRENRVFRELVQRINGSLELHDQSYLPKLSNEQKLEEETTKFGSPLVSIPARLQELSDAAFLKMVDLEKVLHTELAPDLQGWAPDDLDATSRRSARGALAYDEASLASPEKPTRLPASGALQVSEAWASANGNAAPANSEVAMVAPEDPEDASEVLQTLTDLAETWQKIEEGFNDVMKIQAGSK
jgi:voltage-gated sodium channel